MNKGDDDYEEDCSGMIVMLMIMTMVVMMMEMVMITVWWDTVSRYWCKIAIAYGYNG